MKHDKITVDGYEIPVATAFKIHDRVEAFFNGDGIVPAIAIERPQTRKNPAPKIEKLVLESDEAPKPKKSMATRTGNYRRLPSDVLDACRIIKRKADKKGLDIVQFIKTADLCGKKLRFEPSQPVKKYFSEWSKTASDASIRYRLGLPDVDADGNKTKRGGK